MTHLLAWAEGLLTQGHPLLRTLSCSHYCPLAAPGCLQKGEGAGGIENLGARGVGRKLRKGSEQEEGQKREEEREAGRKRRTWDGGGAAHLQIKFVIQASDGPTARD